MISSKFYSQITVCPVCSGWGTTDVPPKGQNTVCKECYGQGVSVTQSENIYIWNAPSFVDYNGRNRVLILKILAILFVAIIFIMFLLIIRMTLSRLV